MKRTLSRLLILGLLLTQVPIQAFAEPMESVLLIQEEELTEATPSSQEEKPAGIMPLTREEESASAEASEGEAAWATPSEATCAILSEANCATPSEAGSLSGAAGLTGAVSNFSEDDILAMVKKKLTALAKNKGGAAAGWVANKFLEKLFPEAGDVDDVESMLDKALENQSKMMTSLGDIKERITAATFETRLNDYKKLSTTGIRVQTAWDTLKNIDEDTTLSDDDRKKERIHAVTNGIGITEFEYDNGTTALDEYVNQLAKMITETYFCTMPDGSHAQLDLAAMHYEYVRLDPQYLFEHEAYDELIPFQAYVYGNFMQAASVQMLSLTARIDLCNDKGLSSKSVEATRNALVKNIEDVQRSLSKTNVERQDTYRYFWVPGYEVKMYTFANLKVKPRESKYSTYTDKTTKIAKTKVDLGSYWKDSLGFVNADPESGWGKYFWGEFWMYYPDYPMLVQSETKSLTGSDYKKLIEGAATRQKSRKGKEETLYQLLFVTGQLSPSYVITADGEWLETGEGDPFLFYPDEQYPFTVTKTDRSCYSLSQKCIGNVKIGSGYKLSTVDFGDYVTDWQGHYYAFQDAKLSSNKYILVARYEENETIDPVFKTEDITSKSEHMDYRQSVSADSAVTPVKQAENGNQMLGSAIISYAQSNLKDEEKAVLIENAFWSKDDKGYWYLTANNGGRYKNCWVLVSDKLSSSSVGNASWYYLGPDGAMLTGWQKIFENNRYVWYYFNKEAGSLYGACLRGGTSPDGFKLGETGAWEP